MKTLIIVLVIVAVLVLIALALAIRIVWQYTAKPHDAVGNDHGTLGSVMITVPASPQARGVSREPY